MTHDQFLLAIVELVLNFILFFGAWNGFSFHIGKSGVELYPAKRFFKNKERIMGEEMKKKVLDDLYDIRMTYEGMTEKGYVDMTSKVDSIDRAMKILKSNRLEDTYL